VERDDHAPQPAADHEASLTGARGSHAALAGPVLGDASIVRGFSFTDALDRLFAAGFPQLRGLVPAPEMSEVASKR
jgi:hypothetical protein